MAIFYNMQFFTMIFEVLIENELTKGKRKKYCLLLKGSIGYIGIKPFNTIFFVKLH